VRTGSIYRVFRRQHRINVTRKQRVRKKEAGENTGNREARKRVWGSFAVN